MEAQRMAPVALTAQRRQLKLKKNHKLKRKRNRFNRTTRKKNRSLSLKNNKILIYILQI